MTRKEKNVILEVKLTNNLMKRKTKWDNPESQIENERLLSYTHLIYFHKIWKKGQTECQFAAKRAFVERKCDWKAKRTLKWSYFKMSVMPFWLSKPALFFVLSQHYDIILKWNNKWVGARKLESAENLKRQEFSPTETGKYPPSLSLSIKYYSTSFQNMWHKY